MTRPSEAEPLSRWWGLVVFACVAAFAAPISQFEPMAVAEAVGGSVGVVLLLAIVFWRYRGQPWFWPFLAAVIAAHVAAIILVPWPREHEWLKGDTFLGVVDFFAMGGIAELLKRFVRTPDPGGPP